MSKPTQTATIPTGNAPAPDGRTTKGMAIASMVCGIVGLLFIGIILGPIAVILGFMAKHQIKQKPQELQGDCQANAGIICGIISIVISIIFIAFYWG